MKAELSFYKDRTSISSLPYYLQQVMRQSGIIQNDDVNVTFCGSVITKQGISVFFPRNSSLPANSTKASFRLAAQYIKAIRRYTQERSSKIDSFDGGEHLFGNQSLDLIIRLIEDYCANGLYSQRLTERVVNSGRPDWNRTISKQTPFPTRGGPIYLDIHGSKRRYTSDCEIARIQAEIIQELDASYAWIVTGSDVPISQSTKGMAPSKGSNLSKLKEIELELTRAFSDRDIHLLKLIRNYLKTAHGTATSNCVIGIRYFHGMWEHIIDETLQWNFPVNKLLPVPAYRFSSEKLVEAAKKGQRTDTVLRIPNSNQFAVVDAKYYGAQGLDSAPGWPDIVKQFFYAKALSVYCPDAEVKNAFVFPGNGPLTHVHMKNRKTGQTEDFEFPPIQCIYVDPIELIKCYMTGQKAIQLSETIMQGLPQVAKSPLSDCDFKL